MKNFSIAQRRRPGHAPGAPPGPGSASVRARLGQGTRSPAAQQLLPAAGGQLVRGRRFPGVPSPHERPGSPGAGGHREGDQSGQQHRPGEGDDHRLGQHRTAVHGVGETAHGHQADQHQDQDEQQGNR